ncbi:MAG: hypothetical protein JXM75_09775 [Chromatiaceae bacterium]|nr:hypothetical protein [Chromatiaceae bacterium]
MHVFIHHQAARLLGALALLALSAPLLAGNPHASLNELAPLPSWCLHTPAPVIRPNPATRAASPEMTDWLERVETSGCARSIHHYCWALIWTSRGQRARDASQRQAHWREAVSDLDYVLDRSTPGCLLHAELLLQKAELLARLREPIAADLTYRLAIDADPDLDKAYAGLSRLLALEGREAEALAILEQGIAANPESVFLRKRLQRLRP